MATKYLKIVRPFIDNYPYFGQIIGLKKIN